MFITGDVIAGIVVGFALGVLAHQAYVKYAHEVVEDEKPTTEIPTEPPKNVKALLDNSMRMEEPKGEPRTYGRSCQKLVPQKFMAAVNQQNICPYLYPSSGYCSFFKRRVFVLGSKYERCAECKAKYPEKQQGR